MTDNGTSLTITGPLTVSGNDAVINGVTVGKGGNSNQYNTAVGAGALANNDTGYNNTAVGYGTLDTNVGGYSNTALGYGALSGNENGYLNTAIGTNALGYNQNGSSSIAIGVNAGLVDATLQEDNENSNTSIFIGPYTRPLAANSINEIVIGNAADGNGSNSVTLGNTSITKTILRSNVGIGTSSPSYPLDVTGTTRVTGTTLITGSLIASGSTHTLTSTTTNINSTTTTLTSTALYLYSNHITASGQTPGDIDLTIAAGVVGSATLNLKANTGGTSILNATGENNTLSIKTNSIERININGNGTTAITGSLSVTGSNTLIGTKTITGSVFISGSKTIIGTNTITGSLNVSGSVTVKGTVSASSFTGSLFGTASYAVTASYVLGSGAAAFPYDGSTTPAVITGSLIVSGSGVTITGSLNVSGSVTVKGTVSASSFTGSLFGTASYALSASSPYKVYTAILNQSSLQPPNPTVLQNTLGGNVTWSCNGAGNYFANLVGAFNAGTTIAFVTTNANLQRQLTVYNADYMLLSQQNLSGTNTDQLTNVGVEIRVYN